MIWRFVFFCFFPMICVFLTPLIFYELPISVRVDQTVLELTSREIYYATLVWVTWIVIAVAVATVYLRNDHPTWDLGRKGLWWGFVGCATLGSLVAAFHQVLQLPHVFENLVQILSLSSTLAIVLGVYLLRLEDIGNRQKLVIALLLVPSAVVTFLFPLLLGYVNPVAISTIGVLYALGAMGIRWRTQAWPIALLGLTIAVALAYKSELRTTLYGGIFERDTILVDWYRQKTEPGAGYPRATAPCVATDNEKLEEQDKISVKSTIQGLVLHDINIALGAYVSAIKPLNPEHALQRAQKGDSMAMLLLGFRAEEDNRGAKNDIVQAQEWYRRAAAKGNSNAMVRLGYLYQSRAIAGDNAGKAVSWYQQAAQRKNVAAMKILSLMYENGYGVARDYARAVTWERRAMDLDEIALSPATLVGALRNLGLLYESGERVGKDLTQAGRWYRRAATLGDGVAMRNLGLMYGDGQGLGYDMERAIACYFDAARHGDAPAMRMLGRLHESGHGLAKDEARAYDWYAQAVTLNDAIAMRHLAAMYETGRGVQKNKARAEELYLRARMMEPIDRETAVVANGKDDFKTYDPNYDKVRWPSEDRHSTLYRAVARIAHRLNSLGNLAYAIRMTPEQVPYSYGETYAPLLYAWIPRIIWKDKPIERTGLLIGLKYGYSKPTDKPLVWSMPTVFESWMAWGWIGVLLTAIAVGLLLRVGWTYLVGNGSAVGNVVFGTLIVMSTAHLAMSSLNLVIGGTVHNLIVYWLLIVIAGKIFKPES